MASIQKSAASAWAGGRVDHARVKATTEAEIERYMRQEGQDPDNPMAGFAVLDDPMVEVRKTKAPRRSAMVRVQKVKRPKHVVPKKLA